MWVFKNCCFHSSLNAGCVTYSNMSGVPFSPIFIFENLTTSCVKLSTLEPFEDQDLPMDELGGSEEEEIVTVVLEEIKEKWDCESICSKYLSIISCENNGENKYFCYKQYENIYKRDSSV